MRLAIIDLGTNSVRFDIYQLNKGQTPRRLHREKLMVRLGQDVFIKGRLNRQARLRTQTAFATFRQLMSLYDVDRVVAFGTSVLRDVADADQLIKNIHKRFGIRLQIISGLKEAQLIAQGVLNNEPKARGRFALIDIGGGSVEISLCVGKRILHSDSFNLGVARLQQQFLQNRRAHKLQLDPIQQLRAHVRATFVPRYGLKRWPKIAKVIGSSGTCLAIAKLYKKHHPKSREVPLSFISKMAKLMVGMTPDELLRIPGMESKRLDLIVAGTLALAELMQILGARSLVPTEYSLRDGILAVELERLHLRKIKSGTFPLSEAYDLAAQFGANLQHLEQVRRLALSLFDHLRRLHHLKPNWKRYLSEAAILHDIGECINPVNHAAHSFYIVNQAPLTGMDEWERDFVARLCLLHVAGKPTPRDIPFWKERTKRLTFLKLLAILRLADALDRHHNAHLKIRQIRFPKGMVHLRVSGSRPLDLELLRLDQKKGLFEKLFKRLLLVEPARKTRGAAN